MADIYEHLQRGSVPSASYTTGDTSNEITLTVQPEEKLPTQPTTTTAVKIILGLLTAGVLVALVVAIAAVVINQKQMSELKEKNHNLEVMLQELQTMLAKPTETDLPQPPTAGASKITSPVTPVTRVPPSVAPTTNTASATTTFQSTGASTSTSPVITARTTITPVTSVSPSVTPTATTTASAATTPPSDTSQTTCAAVHSSHPSARSGVYTIHIGGRVQGREVWCDMETDGGGWTRFQRRQDGSVEFNRTWIEYRNGFGTAETESWLGNDDLHALTSAQPSELRIDLWDWDGNHGYAKYLAFSVQSASTNYRLYVGGYTGSIGDSLTRMHSSRQFSTADRDNDGIYPNCATKYGGGGGWWYGACSSANLNGRYLPRGLNDEYGLKWDTWSGHPSIYSFKAASMMARPRN